MRAGEGKVVRGVESRNHDSEWTPVRHKSKPSSPRTRIDNNVRETRTKWYEVWNPNKGCVTFFFSNFPIDCSTKELFEEFNKIDSVRDIFIPKRLDKKGKTFGFVRFGGNTPVARLERDLNNIWLGSYKLRANISKFARNGASTGKTGKKSRVKPPAANEGVVPRWKVRSDNITYLQASQGNITVGSTPASVPAEKEKVNFVGLSYKSTEEDHHFLSRCFTGQLKGEFPWWETRKEIQLASEGRFQVKYRGGDLVFIQPEEENDIATKDLEAISKWFEFLEPWSNRDAHNVRIVWTKWWTRALYLNQMFKGPEY
ncbi:hypothetical protein ACS0TY_011790 [Phlomoides rotata]